MRAFFLAVFVAVSAAILAVATAFRVSPWPGVLLIRRSGEERLREAAAFDQRVPVAVSRRLDIPYGPLSAERLDVFRPQDASSSLPTIVWVHGGGFVAGAKEALRPYLATLASHGFTVVGIEYTRAPEAHYPTPVRELSDALDHLAAHAADLGVDPDRIVLAGDSAGAHIAAQTALAIVDADYAEAAGLARPRADVGIRATVLACGSYDTGFALDRSVFAWFLHTGLWAYTGTRRFRTDPRISYASLVHHTTAAFPPTFLTAGPADPLLPQSQQLAQLLREAGAEVETLFFEPDAAGAAIGHEYQLRLNTPQAREAMERIVAFAHAHTPVAASAL